MTTSLSQINNREQRHTQRETEGGFSLVVVLCIGLIAMLLIAGLSASVLPSLTSVRASKLKSALRCASEAALDWAVVQLSSNSGTLPNPTYGQTASATSVPSDVISGFGFPITANVTVANVQPSWAAPSTPLQSPAGTTNSYLYDPLVAYTNPVTNGMASNSWRVVTATANCGSTNSVFRDTVRVVLKPMTTTSSSVISGWPFGALAAGDSFTQNGKNATVDYYNSAINANPSSDASKRNTLAGFWTTGYPSDGIHTTLTSTADVSVGISGQSAAGDSLAFSGGGTVGGNLSYMTGASVSGSPTVTYSTSSTFTGNTFPPPGTHPSGATLLSPISGKSSISSGNYYITGSGTAISGGPITINPSSGPVKIYIETTSSQAIQLTGANGLFNNLSGLPENLQIFVTGNGSVNIAGNGEFRGVIYAPYSNVTIGGTGSVYGGIVANNVTMNGSVSGYHFDQQLLNSKNISFNTQTSVIGNLQVVSWQEL